MMMIKRRVAVLLIPTGMDDSLLEMEMLHVIITLFLAHSIYPA